MGDWCQVLILDDLISLFDPLETISSFRSNFSSLLRAATVKGGRRPSRSDLPLTGASTAAGFLDRRRPGGDSGTP